MYQSSVTTLMYHRQFVQLISPYVFLNEIQEQSSSNYQLWTNYIKKYSKGQKKLYNIFVMLWNIKSHYRLAKCIRSEEEKNQ